MFCETRKRIIHQQMNDWRAGWGSIPDDYIQIHKEAALLNAVKLCEDEGVPFLGFELVLDGWGDGMKIVQLITDTYVVYRWSTANGGSWFKGNTLHSIPEIRPDHL